MVYIFIDEDGAVIGSCNGMSLAEAQASIEGMGEAIPLPEGAEMPVTGSFWNGEIFQEFPLVPMPTIGNFGYRLDFANPPAGLKARVYDAEIDPPHLLYDGPLEAPDCALAFTEPAAFRIELTADFPYQPRVLEVSTPITELP